MKIGLFFYLSFFSLETKRDFSSKYFSTTALQKQRTIDLHDARLSLLHVVTDYESSLLAVNCQ